MARSRNIKPGFFKDYDLADAGPYAQLLFIGLWCLADRDGLLEDKPRLIKAEIFPYYDVDINGELTVIERLGHVRRYEVEGIKIIHIVNFKKHQNPHHTEKASELKSLTDDEYASYCKEKEKKLTVNSPLNNGYSTVDVVLIPDSLIPDSLIPDYCSEPSQASEPEAKKQNKLKLINSVYVEEIDENIEISIPTNVSGVYYNVTKKSASEWSAIYPGVDIYQQLRNILGWSLSNPKKRKTASGMPRFINSWLAKEQNAGGKIQQGNYQKTAKFDFFEAAMKPF